MTTEETADSLLDIVERGCVCLMFSNCKMEVENTYCWSLCRDDLGKIIENVRHILAGVVVPRYS